MEPGREKGFPGCHADGGKIIAKRTSVPWEYSAGTSMQNYLLCSGDKEGNSRSLMMDPSETISGLNDEDGEDRVKS